MKWTPVGLGTWMMDRDPKAAIAALRAGIDAGANHIDTAEMYGDGRVEEVVGQALQGLRSKIFLVSKVLPSHADYKGAIEACHRSLKRLQTDHLDAFLLHWREKKTSIAETFRAFEQLKSEGKIRSWGVSNFDVDDMEEAIRLAGEGKIACNQVLYHIKERSIESKLLPWCRSHHVPVVAYSPLGQGRLPQAPALDEVAHRHGASPVQIILAYLTRDPFVFAIPKSSDEKHTRSNIQSMNITLFEDDIQKINKAFPLKGRRHLPMI